MLYFDINKDIYLIKKNNFTGVPVPEAKFIKMENFSPKRKVKMPSGLIDYKPKSVEELENVVEYDMDEEVKNIKIKILKKY